MKLKKLVFLSIALLQPAIGFAGPKKPYDHVEAAKNLPSLIGTAKKMMKPKPEEWQKVEEMMAKIISSLNEMSTEMGGVITNIKKDLGDLKTHTETKDIATDLSEITRETFLAVIKLVDTLNQHGPYIKDLQNDALFTKRKWRTPSVLLKTLQEELDKESREGTATLDTLKTLNW